jgi:hypothetical protein
VGIARSALVAVHLQSDGISSIESGGHRRAGVNLRYKSKRWTAQCQPATREIGIAWRKGRDCSSASVCPTTPRMHSSGDMKVCGSEKALDPRNKKPRSGARRGCPSFTASEPPAGLKTKKEGLQRALTCITKAMLIWSHEKNAAGETERRATGPAQGQPLGNALRHRLHPGARSYLVDDLPRPRRPNDPGEHGHRRPGSRPANAGRASHRHTRSAIEGAARGAQ